jgi:hypothetical protein
VAAVEPAAQAEMLCLGVEVAMAALENYGHIQDYTMRVAAALMDVFPGALEELAVAEPTAFLREFMELMV